MQQGTTVALFDQILPSGDFDVALFGWSRTPEGMADFYGCGGVVNFTGYCQLLVTRALNDADRTLNVARRAEVLNRADAQIARDVPVIPLYLPRFSPASRTNRRRPSATSPMEDWWLER